MMRATAEERALARATMYRLLAAAFSYPTTDNVTEIRKALDVAEVAAALIDRRTAEATAALGASTADTTQPEFEAAYQRSFTLSYSEDCPLYETAFSSRHIFQQTQHQADIAGFYRAFGVDPNAERPDHIAVELEFLYLLAVKEAWARDGDEPDHVAVCRQAQRTFLRDHLARWAPVIAGRVAIAGRGTAYEAAARLLLAFVEREERYLRLGTVESFGDEPVLIADEPGEFTCPMEDTPTPIAITSLKEGGHHAPVGAR